MASATEKEGKRKEKKSKRTESEGVTKPKKEKKEKKLKKEKLAQALDEHLQASAAASAAGNDDDDAMKDSDTEAPAHTTSQAIPRGAIVEFALPLATEKYQKKVFKAIKKGESNDIKLRTPRFSVQQSLLEPRTQHPRSEPSSAAPRKSTRPSAKHHRGRPRAARRRASWWWRATSRRPRS
jgi:hypothetical protein